MYSGGVSAGNGRTDRLPYPAAYAEPIKVAATNHRDERGLFSNYGPGVDVAAPGELVLSTVPNNRYDYLSGTSMSAPHVSGIAALVRSLHPEFTVQQVDAILRNAVDPIATDKYLGLGRVNAARAVRVGTPLPTAHLSIAPVVSGQIDLSGTATSPPTNGMDSIRCRAFANFGPVASRTPAISSVGTSPMANQ